MFAAVACRAKLVVVVLEERRVTSLYAGNDTGAMLHATKPILLGAPSIVVAADDARWFAS